MARRSVAGSKRRKRKRKKSLLRSRASGLFTRTGNHLLPRTRTFNMKTLGMIIAVCLAAFAAVAASGSAIGDDQVLTRISNETGVPIHTLRRQEAETGLGFGNLE